MLAKIRSGLNSIIIRVILSIVLMSFLGLGVIGLIQMDSPGVAISFRHAPSVSMAEFWRARRDKMEALSATIEHDTDGAHIEQMLLDELITQSMIRYLVMMYEFNVGDEVVVSAVKKAPHFLNSKGEFDLNLYNAAFRNSKEAEEVYLNTVRNTLMGSAVSKILKWPVVPKIMKNNFAHHNCELKVVDIYEIDLLSSGNSRYSAFKEDEDALRAFYDGHQEEFFISEKRSFEYIKITEEMLRRFAKVTDEEMKDFYYENREEFGKNTFYKVKQQVRTRLIDAKLAETGMLLSKELEDAVVAGMSLEKIASKYSCSITEVKDISKQELLTNSKRNYKDIAERVFSMAEGNLHYPIDSNSDRAIFLVRLSKVLPSRVKSFEEAKSIVRKLFRAEQLSKYNLESFTNFMTSVKVNTGEADDAALKKFGIKLTKRSDFCRANVANETLPLDLLSEIFSIQDGSRTKVYQRGTRAYCAVLKQSFIDKKRIDVIQRRNGTVFEDSVRELLFQEVIGHLIKENEPKVVMN